MTGTIKINVNLALLKRQRILLYKTQNWLRKAGPAAGNVGIEPYSDVENGLMDGLIEMLHVLEDRIREAQGPRRKFLEKLRNSEPWEETEELSVNIAKCPVRARRRRNGLSS